MLERPLLAAALLAATPAAIAARHDVEPILDEMATFVERCVQPSDGIRVFTRCLDLHSSIHAHWAAYRIARVRPRQFHLARTSETALEYEKLRYERRFIDYPYAAAWFLRLAIEFEGWCVEHARPDPFRMRPVADDVARWLLELYEAGPVDPYQADYANPAWAVYQLWSYLDLVQDARKARVQVLIDSAFLRRIQTASFGRDLAADRFFSTYGNWLYLMAKTQDAARFAEFLALQDPIPDRHLVVNDLSTAHSSGLGWSRAWALRALSLAAPDGHERVRFARSADLHVEVGMRRHELLRGDWFGYDHWVLQFAVYGATEGLLRD